MFHRSHLGDKDRMVYVTVNLQNVIFQVERCITFKKQTVPQSTRILMFFPAVSTAGNFFIKAISPQTARNRLYIGRQWLFAFFPPELSFWS